MTETMRSRLWLIVSWGLFLLASFPTARWYVRRVTDRSDEPLGLIALAAFGFLLWTRRRDLRCHLLRMAVGSVILIAITATFHPPYPMIIALGVLGVFLSSVDLREGKAGLSALLILSLPLMASLDFYIGSPMRIAAAELSRWILTGVGLSITRAGTLLQDGATIVGVDPPCSGVRMLWTCLFVAAVLATFHRLGALRTGVLMFSAAILVVIGNSLRAAILFFPESGRVHWPHAAHEVVGLLCQGLVLAAVVAVSQGLERRAAVWPPSTGSPRPRGLPGIPLAGLAAAGVAVLATVAALPPRPTHPSPAVEAVWPATLDGVRLEPVPLTKREARFAEAFPGLIGRFQWGESEVILRHVTRATRLLHSSADCLRAAGFATSPKPPWQDPDGRVWGCFDADHDGKHFRVRERITSTSQSQVHTDVSSWFWAACWSPADGPWVAMTVIEPAS